MFKHIIKTAKINHYIKNIVVFIPLIFSMNILNGELFFKTIIAFISLCFISSAVYILNDIIDKDKDKNHPIKSKRPIASGELSTTKAITAFSVFLGLSCLLAFSLNLLSLIIVLCYLLLNILYSIKFKNIPLIDATCIALGFILRIIVGCTAISVVPSALVIILTFFSSMFFTFSKRKLELKLLKEDSKCRDSIKNFDENLINHFILINAVLSIAFYFTYVLDATTIEKAGTSYLYITVLPFTLIVFHLLYLGNITSTDDPIVFFEKDKTLRILILIFILTFAIIISLGKIKNLY